MRKNAKILIFAALALLAVFALFGCSARTIKYDLGQLKDDFVTTPRSAKVGEVVTIKTNILFDAGIHVYVDGEEIKNTAVKDDTGHYKYWEYSFTMPDKNVTITAKPYVEEEVYGLCVPEDFTFSLVWGCGGDSYYDSKTGTLVKQNCATNVKDFTTVFYMSDLQKAEIYDLICDMQPETYPDSFDPLIGASAPSRTIILTVKTGNDSAAKTITCKDVTLGNEPNGKMGEKFMKVHDKIVKIVTSSNEWRSLPEYEFFYD